jgi:hypothetical protein
VQLVNNFYLLQNDVIIAYITCVQGLFYTETIEKARKSKGIP